MTIQQLKELMGQYECLEAPKGKREYSVIVKDILDNSGIEYTQSDDEKTVLIKSRDESLLKEEIAIMFEDMKKDCIDNWVNTLSIIDHEKVEDVADDINRLGKITGSNNPFDTNGKKIPTYKQYVNGKKIENFLQVCDYYLKVEIEDTQKKRFETHMMNRGNRIEQIAFNRIAKEYLGDDWTVTDSGFMEAIGLNFGATPDLNAVNMIDYTEKTIQIKSPAFNTFCFYKEHGGLAQHYKAQLHLEMIVTNTKEIDIIAFFPLQPLLVETMEMDYDFMWEMIQTIEDFNYDINRDTPKEYTEEDVATHIILHVAPPPPATKNPLITISSKDVPTQTALYTHGCELPPVQTCELPPVRNTLKFNYNPNGKKTKKNIALGALKEYQDSLTDTTDFIKLFNGKNPNNFTSKALEEIVNVCMPKPYEDCTGWTFSVAKEQVVAIEENEIIAPVTEPLVIEKEEIIIPLDVEKKITHIVNSEDTYYKNMADFASSLLYLKDEDVESFRHYTLKDCTDGFRDKILENKEAIINKYLTHGTASIHEEVIQDVNN